MTTRGATRGGARGRPAGRGRGGTAATLGGAGGAGRAPQAATVAELLAREEETEARAQPATLRSRPLPVPQPRRTPVKEELEAEEERPAVATTTRVATKQEKGKTRIGVSTASAATKKAKTPRKRKTPTAAGAKTPSKKRSNSFPKGSPVATRQDDSPARRLVKPRNRYNSDESLTPEEHQQILQQNKRQKAEVSRAIDVRTPTRTPGSRRHVTPRGKGAADTRGLFYGLSLLGDLDMINKLRARNYYPAALKAISQRNRGEPIQPFGTRTPKNDEEIFKHVVVIIQLERKEKPIVSARKTRVFNRPNRDTLAKIYVGGPQRLPDYIGDPSPTTQQSSPYAEDSRKFIDILGKRRRPIAKEFASFYLEDLEALSEEQRRELGFEALDFWDAYRDAKETRLEEVEEERADEDAQRGEIVRRGGALVKREVYKRPRVEVNVPSYDLKNPPLGLTVRTKRRTPKLNRKSPNWSEATLQKRARQRAAKEEAQREKAAAKAEKLRTNPPRAKRSPSAVPPRPTTRAR